MTVTLVDGAAGVPCAVALPEADDLDPVVGRVRRWLDLDHDPCPVDAHLADDPVLASVVAARPGLRVVGSTDGWETAVTTVLGQQVSVSAARTFAGRLVRAATPDGHPAAGTFPASEAVAALDPAVLRPAVGLTEARARTVHALATAVADGLALGWARCRIGQALGRVSPPGGRTAMLRNPDHVTIAVSNAATAIEFFELLGFRKQHVATIDGGLPAQYMGMPDMKAQHITLALEGCEPRFEIQLLEFDPSPPDDPGEHPTNRRRRGYNHVAFRVDDIGAVTTHLVANGVKLLSDEMDYISRRLRFFEGPEGITLELVQWVGSEGNKG